MRLGQRLVLPLVLPALLQQVLVQQALVLRPPLQPWPLNLSLLVPALAILVRALWVALQGPPQPLSPSPGPQQQQWLSQARLQLP